MGEEKGRSALVAAPHVNRLLQNDLELLSGKGGKGERGGRKREKAEK